MCYIMTRKYLLLDDPCDGFAECSVHVKPLTKTKEMIRVNLSFEQSTIVNFLLRIQPVIDRVYDKEPAAVREIVARFEMGGLTESALNRRRKRNIDISE